MSINEVTRQEGIPANTLYGWRSQAGITTWSADSGLKLPKQWSQEARFAVLVETAPLSAHAVAEYCRRKGLYPEQIQQWKDELMQPYPCEEKAEIKRLEKENQQLNREIARKDKALAEAAALLILEKNSGRSSSKNVRPNDAYCRQVADDNDGAGGCCHRCPTARSLSSCRYKRTDVPALATDTG
ncbi:transposase [Serratia marcescens subsp. marcescens ATCC 13880]|nr:transposase [Serratia marcescens]QSO56732.1 transposase [Serratia marcescens subsp. marcescens ATCC 13880]QSO61484.1 transposase [Serratia marcescens subsp. marcescens ATCC 13880]QSO66234.1 transposase [Serratia marcescens subsp. marcescens ATCC 13880]QSO70985.1 transposase [Serratia marcescens subsp. marcescens ATCC 13880]